MMKSSLILLAVCLASLSANAQSDQYGGQQLREIKALAPERVSALLRGDGLGYAKAAELNGWPGPLHALELADDLSLDPNQRRTIEELRGAMLAEAQPLGARLVEAEERLDRLFAQGAPDRAAIASATAAIALLEGELRAVHLAAHVSTKPVLTDRQRATYQRLRGYGDVAAEQEQPHGGAAHQHH